MMDKYRRAERLSRILYEMEQKECGADAKRRGRPRAYDPDQALQRAMEAFWRTGYSGTSLDEIAVATGMNRPSLKAAFGDKHALYVMALRAYWERKFAVMHEALLGGTLREALMRTYEAALTIYFAENERAMGCFVLGTAITEAVEDPEIGEIVLTGFRRLDADFETRICSAKAAGELKSGVAPHALAMLATGMMQTIALRARAGVPRDELEQLARDAVDVICR